MSKKTIGIFALLAIGLIFAGSLVSAGNYWSNNLNKGDIQQAIQDGDYTKWKSLNEDMLTKENFESLKYQEPKGIGFNDENHAEMKSAIENDDYEAYSEAVLKIHPSSKVLSEDDFTVLTEMHQARMNGDLDKWSELRSEIQDEIGFGSNYHLNNRMGNSDFANHENGMGSHNGHHSMNEDFDCPFMEN